MKREQIINRLTNAIKNGKFAFEKYYNRGMWYGVKLQITDMFCSYGIIGYIVSVYNEDKYGRLNHIAQIEYDWDLNRINVKYFDN